MTHIVLEKNATELRLEFGQEQSSVAFGAAQVETLQQCQADYERALQVQCGDPQALLAIGERLAMVLDADGWLSRVWERVDAVPWTVEFRVGRRDKSAAAEAFLNAPWELLVLDGKHLALDQETGWNPLRRIGQAGDVVAPSPFCLQVVFMAASPVGQQVLDYEAEESAILQATASQRIELVVEESGSLQQLAGVVTDNMQQVDGQAVAPDVVHVSCHGMVRDGQVVLALESEAGELVEVGAEDWLGQPSLQQPRLVFVSACHTAHPSSDVADHLAGSLLRRGLPAVLGWGNAVRDGEASMFATQLYLSLASQQDIATAVGNARMGLLREQPQARDWHLARLFLGTTGGGVLASGQQARRQAVGYQEAYLDADKQVKVAGQHEFVGRRRQLQRVLQAFRECSHAGVVLHGMGRQGKSSLAARIGRRLQATHKTLVVYGRYRAEHVLQAFAVLGESVAGVLREQLNRVANQPDHLADVLQNVLEGLQQPVLLVIDDLEQILEGHEGRDHTVQGEYLPVIVAVVTAFSRCQQCASQLLFTSRYTFVLPQDLQRELLAVPLPAMEMVEREKQWRSMRQRLDAQQGVVLEESRLVRQALWVAQGNAGLQDKLYRLVREKPADAAAVLQQVEAWQQDQGAIAGIADETVRGLLEGLVLQEIYQTLTAEEQTLLQDSQAFHQPLPLQVLELLANEESVRRLLALGLWDGQPDVVNPRLVAAGLNRLALGLLEELQSDALRKIAEIVIEPLWECWKVHGRSGAVQYELTHLASLAERVEVLRETAATGMRYAYEFPQKRGNQYAATLGEQAIALLQAAGEAVDSDVLLWTARNFQQSGCIDKSVSLLERRIEQLPQHDHYERAVTLGDIARIEKQKGNIEQALQLHQEMLNVFESLGDLRSRAVTLGDIADICLLKEQLPKARELYEEKWQIAEQLQDLDTIAHARWSLGKICVQQEDWQTAADHLGTAYQLLMQLGRLDGVVFVGLDYGQLLLAAGHQDDAREIFQRSYEGLLQLGQEQLAEQVREAFLV